MRIVIRTLDRTLITYQAMIQRVGEYNAKLAFRRALNHTGRTTFTRVKRALAKQTSIKVGTINAGVKFIPASGDNLSTIIEGTGQHIPLKEFGAKQFSYGVRAKVWGRNELHQSAFIVAKYDGHVYKRTSRKRFPIKRLWGPSIPVELVKDAAVATFEQHTPDVEKRALHELSRILK